VTDSLRTRIRARRLTVGSWISIGHPAIAEIMAKAGFDWLVIDLEHSVIGIEAAGDLIRTIDLCGVAPLVRVTSNDPDQIKRVMDAGAHGIVVPMVNSAAEAARAVAATRYAPAGSRGVGLSRAQGYGVGFDAYLQWQHDGPIVIAQIEHKDALNHLDAIVAVPGIDGVIIGPYDLSCSMGIPGQFERAEYLAAMAQIRDTANRLGCASGLHLIEPDPAQLERTILDGYTLVAYSVDFRILDVGLRQGLARIKGLRA
jgi:2-keto-3-deoxy-L-rhamnonate aldolase RhmA